MLFNIMRVAVFVMLFVNSERNELSFRNKEGIICCRIHCTSSISRGVIWVFEHPPSPTLACATREDSYATPTVFFLAYPAHSRSKLRARQSGRGLNAYIRALWPWQEMRGNISAHAHIYVCSAGTPPVCKSWKRHCCTEYIPAPSKLVLSTLRTLWVSFVEQ